MSKRIILLEGIDGSGKSTLIKNIMTDRTTKVHNGLYPSPTAAYESYVKQLEASAVNQQTWLIDRMHISEVIYGKVMRGKKMSNRQFDDIETRLNEQNAICILALPDYETAFENWKSRLHDEHVQDEGKFYKIYEAYTGLGALTSLPMVVYDYTNPMRSLYEITKELLK